MATKKKTKVTLYEISGRVRDQALTQPHRPRPGEPAARPLRIYALDPSVSHRLGGIATVNIPYEEVLPGPRGSLFEIDWAGAPKPLEASALDLNEPALLLSGGLSPTPANGRFHLQMIYAVCNLTYARFEKALGREIAWAAGVRDEVTGQLRLRVKPFALEEQNAFYDRNAFGLCFGYFNAPEHPGGHTVPRGLIFTGLSHDVIVHETTHALLDALRSEFYSPTNPDVLGFHEGFADLVALFQHFSYTEVVEQAMRESRGSLTRAGLLTSIAQEFGHATSQSGAAASLRSGVDVANIMAFDSDVHVPGSQDPQGLLRYEFGMEAHRLGTVLVSAVFEAFVTVFRRRSERYFRIAGLAPDAAGQADLSTDLIKALAQEASELAGHFLDICIRAIDYCPPVDMDIAEYLRALITADADVVANDKWGYREALMRSFRRRELFPKGIAFMSEDAIKWCAPDEPLSIPELAFSELRFNGDPGHAASADELERQATILGEFVTQPKNAKALHLIPPAEKLPRNVTYASPIRVQSIRCARRVAPDGHVLFDLIAEVTQSRTMKVKNELFDFMGGSTLVIDPFGHVRLNIFKRVDSKDRQNRQLAAMRGNLKQYWKKVRGRYEQQGSMFALLHKSRR